MPLNNLKCGICLQEFREYKTLRVHRCAIQVLSREENPDLTVREMSQLQIDLTGPQLLNMCQITGTALPGTYFNYCRKNNNTVNDGPCSIFLNTLLDYCIYQ